MQRLGIDYIDIYYLHWTDGVTPIEETLEKLIEIRETGKVRSLGVSNLSIPQINKIKKFDLSALQIKGNLLEPQDIYEYSPLAKEINASLFTFSKLVRILSGKFNENSKFAKMTIEPDILFSKKKNINYV